MTNTINPTTPSKAQGSGSRRTNALPSGCMLDEYRIDAILGAGGFGVTYKARDTHLESWVAIKEYFPVEWSFRDADGVTVHPNTQGQTSETEGQVSDYLWGLERFLDEARVLARIQHPHVVRVKRYFRAHGTAYIVMDFEEGEPLNAVLQDNETLGEDEVRGLLDDVLPALQAVHEQGYLHRDIKPANLYLRSSDHRVILIDFGAARLAVGRHSKSVTSLVTPGYSPPEQYTTRNDRYGTWTDIYALGAVLYRCITGHTPVEAAERLLDDNLEPVVAICAGRYSTNLLRVIDRALAVRPEQRFRTVAEMQTALSGSGDDDGDETVIMPPPPRFNKPAPAPAPALTGKRARPEEPPTAETPMVDQWTGQDGPKTVVKPTIRNRRSVLDQKPDARTTAPDAPRWRRMGILAGGGLTLAVLAATVVWLWWPTPAPNQHGRLDETPTASLPPAAAPTTEPPATVSHTGTAGTVAETPPTAPAAVQEPAAPLREPEVETRTPAQSTTATLPAEGKAMETTAGPGSAEQPTDRTAAETASPPKSDAVDAQPPLPEPATTEAASAPHAETAGGSTPPSPAPAAALQPGAAKQTATTPDADKKLAPRDTETARRSGRQKATQNRGKPQPIVATPEKPAPISKPAAPRDSSWDSPSSTGFNQK